MDLQDNVIRYISEPPSIVEEIVGEILIRTQKFFLVKSFYVLWVERMTISAFWNQGLLLGTYYYAFLMFIVTTTNTTGFVQALSAGQQLRIAFVTGNAMKAKEMQSILYETNVMVMRGDLEEDGSDSNAIPNLGLIDLRVVQVDLPEIQEVDTLAIAKHKAIQGAQLVGGACVVEDTSLKFHALGGMPGPYIKWFMQKLGVTGLHKILFAYEDKSATACCTLAFCPYPHGKFLGF